MPKPLGISDLSTDEHVEEAIRPGRRRHRCSGRGLSRLNPL
jgi:hypothetical protein